MAAASRTTPLTTWRHLQRVSLQPATPLRPRLPLPLRSLALSPRMRTYSTNGTSPSFSYHIAASFIGKDRRYEPSKHVFHHNPNVRIQPPRNRPRSARPDSGHDAFFVSPVNASSSIAVGVTDGVGGWVDSGVDPADFSHGFCDYMATAAFEHQPDGKSLTARSVMQRGYEAVCHDPSIRAGGSTACVAVGASDGTLDVANLGDSGFIHVRLNAIHSHTEPQTHAFNTPYQLSVVPPEVAKRAAVFGGTQLCDLPRDADVSQHRMRHGDIIIFATDGVLDNLYNQDILRIVSKVMMSTGAWSMTEKGAVRVADSLDPLTLLAEKAEGAAQGEKQKATLQSLLATELVHAAKLASINTKRDGPFAKEVQKYYPQENWRGGKIDDICVVAAVISEDVKPIQSKL